MGSTHALASLTLTNAAKLNSSSITTVGNQLFSGAVNLANDNTLTSTTGTIGFASTINSLTSTAESLTLTANGLTSLNGSVGATHALNNLTITNAAYLNGNSVKTSGNQLYSGVVTLGTNNVLTASAGSISFGSAIDSATAMTPESLTLTASGLSTLNADVGLNHTLSSLTISNAALLNGSTVTTSGNQQYSGAVTLGTDNTLNAASGTINFGSTVDSANSTNLTSLNVNASGTTTFTGAVGSINALNNLVSSGAGTVVFSSAVGSSANRLSSISILGNTAMNGASIYTSGNQSYTGAVSLGSNNLLNANAGTVSFASTIDSANVTPQSLTVNASGLSTFNGAIGGAHALNNLTVSNTARLNGGSINTNGSQLYSGAVTLGVDNTLTAAAGTIGFASTINSAATTADSLTVTASGLATFNGAVGNTNALNLLTVTNAAKLNGSSITTSGNQLYSGAVTLGNDNVLTSSVGTINFGNTVDSASSTAADSLTLTANGLTTINNTVGATNALNILTITNAGVLNGNSINTTGNQVYSGAVTLGTDNILSASSGAISFASTVDSATTTPNSLTLTASGLSTFNGAVGATHALNSLTVSNAAMLNGNTITTNSNQLYSGAVSLGTNNLLTSGGSIGFASTVDSATSTAKNLTLTATGLTSLNAALGVTNAIHNLTITNASLLNGNSITTSGNQQYSGVVSLGTNNLLTSGGTVNFANTVNSLSATAENLTLTAIGLTSFNNTVGATHALNNVTVTNSAYLNGASVNTSGNQVYNGVTTLGTDNTLTASAGFVKFNNTLDSATSTPDSLTVTASGNSIFNAAVGAINVLNNVTITNATLLNSGSFYTNGYQQYNGAVTLVSDNLLSSGSTINFASTVDSNSASAQSLTLTAAGLSTFNNTVGATHALNNLTITNAAKLNGSSVNTSGNQQYNGTVVLGTNNTLTAAGTINFANSIDSASATAENLIVTATGLTSINGAVGSSNVLNNLTVTNTSLLNGNSITTSNNQLFSGAVTLGTDNTLTAGGTVTFNSTVDSASSTTAHSLNLNAVNTSSFNGAVGTINAINALNSTGAGNVVLNNVLGSSTNRVATLSINGATRLNGASIYTSGNQHFTGAVTLGNDNTLNASAGTINFTSTVDSATSTPESLIATASGLTTFNGAVGASKALNNVTVTNASLLNGNSVTTSGNQLYSGSVALGTNNLLTSAGTITFGSTVDSATSTAENLTLTGTGLTTFNGSVGATHALNNLTITNAAKLAGNSITTNANQLYSGAVALGTDNLLTASAGTISFGSTVDSLTGSSDNLTLTASSLSTFNGSVGSTKALNNLTITNTADLNGNQITTAGNQLYSGAVTLGTDNLLTANNGAITFSSTVDSLDSTPRTLTLTASGLTTLNGKVGFTHTLNGLTITNAADLNGLSINTIGNQQYSGAVMLGSSNTLTANTANIHFSSTVDSLNASANDLTVTTSGNTTFDGAVGSNFAINNLTSNGTGSVTVNNILGIVNRRMGSLSIAGIANLNGSAIYSSGAQNFNSAVNLGAASTILSTTNNDITFAGTVNGNDALTFNVGSNNVNFNSNVGTATNGALASINVTSGNTVINGNVTTSNAQTYATTSLTHDSTLTGNNITLGGVVSGNAHNLTLSDSGASVLGAAVNNLTTIRTNVVNINGGAVTTSGAQNYGNATLGNDAILTGNNINMNGTVVGSGHSLTLADGGVSTFAGAVSGLNNLQTNVININGATVSSTGAQSYGNVSLGSNTTLTGNNIDITGTVVGAAHSLVLSDAGTSEFDGAVSGLTTLQTNVINFNGVTVTTSGAQTYGNAILNKDTTLTGANINLSGTVVGNGHALTLSDGATSTFGGAVSGLNTLQVNAQTAIDINGGSIASTGAQSYTGPVVLGADATLSTTAATGNVTINSAINGGSTVKHALTINNASTASTTTLNAAASNLSALNINSTNIALNGGSVNGLAQNYQGNVTLGVNTSLTGNVILGANTGSSINNSGNSLTITSPGNSNINGTLNGSGSLTFNGTTTGSVTGMLDLNSGTNSFTGTTTINSGILQLGATDALKYSSNVIVNGGATFDLANFNNTLTMLTGAGNVNLGSGALTVNNSAADSFTGNISGVAGSLNKTGSGTLSLSGNSSYTGGTNIYGGIISVSSNTALGTGLATVNTGAELNLVGGSNALVLSNAMSLYGQGISQNGALNSTGSNVTVNGSVTVNNYVNNGSAYNVNEIVTPGQSDSLTLNGVISGYDLNKGGAGQLVISNANNNYQGNTNVNGGVLELLAQTAIPTTSAVNLSNGGSILELSGFDITIGSLQGSGSISLLNGANLFTGSDNTSTTFTGSIIGTGNVTKLGTGTLTLDGTNDFTGTTYITKGVLNFLSNATLGTVNVSTDASLELSGSAITANSIILNGAGMTQNGTAMGALVTSGVSSITSAINLASNATAVNTGTLTINGDINSASGGNYSLNVSNTGVINLYGQVGNVTALASFTAAGNGLWNVYGDNNSNYMGAAFYTSGNQEFDGPIVLDASTVMNSTSGSVTLNSTVDGNYDLAVTDSTGAYINGAIGNFNRILSFTSTGNGTHINGGAISTIGSQTYNDLVTLGANTYLSMNNDGTITLMNGVTGPGYNLALSGNNGTNNFNIGGTVSLNKLSLTGGAGGSNNFNLSGNFNINQVNIDGGSMNNNTMSIQTNNSAQNYVMSGADTGYMTGVANNSFNFTNIENIAEGATSNNYFALVGGTLSGYLTGGTGNNTIAADNINNVINLLGYNSGYMTGIGSFSGIQNLIGGTGNNMYNFYNDALIGTINNPNTTSINTLNYASYRGAVNVTTTSDHGGYTSYGGSNVTSFNNVTNLVSNGNGTITIGGVNKTNIIHITGAAAGYINDPLVFNGFNIIANSSSSITTKIIFDAPAVYNSTQQTAVVNGVTFNISGIQGVSGSITSQVNAAQASAIVSAINSINSVSSSGSSGSSTSGTSSGTGNPSTPTATSTVSDNLSDISSGGDGSSSGGSSGGSSSGSSGGSSTTTASSSKVATNCS